MSIRRYRLDLRLLVGSFVAVALTFFAANALTQYSLRDVDVASDDIAFNSAPSIQSLAGVRTAVRHSEFLLGTTLATGSASARSAIDAALAQLNGDADAYLTLPTFPGEKGFWSELNGAITEFNAAVQRVLVPFDAGAVQAARSGLPDAVAAADRVAKAAGRAIEFNAQAGREQALRVKSVRRATTVVAYALNASCFTFAVLAALVVRRQLRRYGELIEEHAALQESRATELEEFAGRAAHDILNPVSATQTALALAIKRGIEDGRTRELLDRAMRNQLRVRNIIDGLLQFARAGARPSPGAHTYVPSVIEDVAAGVRPTAEAAGTDIRVGDVPPCHARCSVGVLTSIVSNLALNALKYMGDRGTKRITLRASARRGVVHVEVEDTGPGIPSESLDDIFHAYVRGPTQGQDGLGLGLAIVRRLCEAHGGRCGVQSTIGQGSIFWIEMPRYDAAPTPSSSVDVTPADGGGSAGRTVA